MGIFFRKKQKKDRNIKIIRDYFKKNKIRKLNIGCGKILLDDSWLNSDINPINKKVIFLDATKSFRFRESTFDYIHSEHQIEHLKYKEGINMIKECFRVLKPKGKIRISTLDFEKVMALFNKNKTQIQEQYRNWIIKRFLDKDRDEDIFAINTLFHEWGHKFLYDYNTLKNILMKSGFKNIKKYKQGESKNIYLKNIDIHDISEENKKMTKFETIAIEAEKPDEED